MASRDNCDSLLEMLQNDKIDYLLITLDKGKKSNNANVNVNVPNKKSAQIFLEILYETALYLFNILESKPRKKRKKKK